MSRNNKQRYDGALEYIRTKISTNLAREIQLKVTTTAMEKSIGGKISLAFRNYKDAGTKQQHWAVRALCMCQEVFLKNTDVSEFVRSSVNLTTTKDFYLNKAEDLVKKAIRCYEADSTATIQELAGIAGNEMLTTDNTPYETSLRSDKGMGTSSPVCFHAVRCWLYKAGFVSLRWMATTGYSLTANNCNQILGQGQIITPDQIDNIPVGYLFNFHAQGDQAVTHWGISLGAGMAAGSNTTPGELDYRNGKQPIFTTFDRGQSTYGVFDLTSAYNVCSNKYQLGDVKSGKVDKWRDIVIRQINPRAVTTYF